MLATATATATATAEPLALPAERAESRIRTAAAWLFVLPFFTAGVAVDSAKMSWLDWRCSPSPASFSSTGCMRVQRSAST